MALRMKKTGMSASGAHGADRVLMLSRRRETHWILTELSAAGIQVVHCPDGNSLLREARSGAGALLVDRDALAAFGEEVKSVVRQFENSKLPLLLWGGPEGELPLEPEIVFALDRSISPPALLSTVRGALSYTRSLRARPAPGQDAGAVGPRVWDRFRSVFDRAAVGIALLDAAGRILLVNPHFGRMLGYEPDELAGRSIQDITHPEEIPADEQYDSKLRAGEIDACLREKRYLRRDGSVMRGEMTCCALRGASGEIECIVAVVLDVTEHRQAVEALRISEERLRLAADAAQMGIWQWDLHEDRQQWDERCKALFGLPAEVSGSFRTWLESLHPEDRPRLEAAVPRFLSGEEDQEKEYRIVRPDGTVRWMYARGATHFDSAGKPLRMIGIVMDVTDRREAEEALRIGEERHRLAAEGAGFGTWEWFIERDEFSYDEQCLALFGDPELREISLEAFFSMLHPDDRDRMRAGLPEVLSKPDIHLEYRVVLPDGSVHWHMARGRVWFKGGKAVRTAGIIMDVTARKMVEEMLQQAKGAAEAASRAKSEFLANISHEIRTPMTVTMGALELLQGTTLDEDQRLYLDMAQTASDALLRLIDEILDFSRIESGRMLFEKEPFDLRGSLEGAVGGFAREATRKGLRLDLEIAPEVPPIVVGDAGRLRQVLSNLLSNAVKFTEKGEITVSAGIRKDAAGGDTLLFAVRDTGIGIPGEKRHLLFQTFSQVDSSHTRRYGGTGLGLALSRNLVRRMGGEIWMESESEKGSTFYFTLPLLPAEEEPRGAVVEKKERRETMDREIRSCSRRILLAEDDTMVRELVEMILRHREWEVVTAATGKATVSAWETGDPDLILMDVQMPEMDGLEATRIIREREKGTGDHIPIVAMTAHARDEDRDQCLEAGMDDYLAKPIQMADLYQMVERFLGTGPGNGNEERSGFR